MKSMSISDSRRLQMLEWREGILDTVLDTDTATEVDDRSAAYGVCLCAGCQLY